MSRSGLVDRLLEIRGLLEREPSPTARRWLLIVAAVVFLGGTVVGGAQLDLDPAEIRWGFLVLAGAVAVPATAAVNALEYHTSGAVMNRPPDLGGALRVSVLGTAANLLPLPGASLVRLRGLRQLGSDYGDATMATAAIGVAWIAVAASLVGGWLVAVGRPLTGAPFLAGGLVALWVVFQLLGRVAEAAERRLPALGRVVAVELLLVGISVLRQWLVLLALGADAALAGAVVLVLSAALAGAAGIFPGGLGLREAISALLAPVMGLPPSFGFLGAAVNRILGIVVHAPLALALSAAPGIGLEEPGVEADRESQPTP